MEHSYKLIDELLLPYQAVIGRDYERYKNHVSRVFSFCQLIDPQTHHTKKYATAAVFHDIGIWTAQTIDYLEPSKDQLKQYLTLSQNAEWLPEITEMIHWHHKIGPYQQSRFECVETFRKADWIDVSLGWITFGIPSSKIKGIQLQFTNLGFHRFLVKKIASNLLKHPLNPLPMFKI